MVGEINDWRQKIGQWLTPKKSLHIVGRKVWGWPTLNCWSKNWRTEKKIGQKINQPQRSVKKIQQSQNDGQENWPNP